MDKKALLLGNGINNIKQTYSWSQLVGDLLDMTGASGQIERRFDKPFPLLYEELLIAAIKKRNISEREIKQYIANQIIKFEPNNIHKELIDIGISDILTTNYDLCFEKLCVDNPMSLKNEGIIKESLYGIFRHYSCGDYRFWHLHGDANMHMSITLGYEHYSGYLQQMRNYVLTGTGSSYKLTKFDPIVRRIKRGIKEKDTHSWLDLFFTHDIYIIGLTLDFMEMHLWWLFTCRIRMKWARKLPVKNKIVYFYPSTLAEKIKSKLDLFTSCGVVPYSIKGDPSKDSFYLEIIDKVKKGI